MDKIKKYFWIIVSRVDKYLFDYAILKFLWDKEAQKTKKADKENK
jgi:hypothetical protein